jgi:hypothetical protein
MSGGDNTSEPQVACGATVGSSNRRNCFGTRKSGTHEELREKSTISQNPLLTTSKSCAIIRMFQEERETRNPLPKEKNT